MNRRGNGKVQLAGAAQPSQSPLGHWSRGRTAHVEHEEERSSGLNERTPDRERTGPRKAALVALLLLLALSLTTALLLGPGPSRAQSSTYLGLDLVSDGNYGALLDSVQDCVEVQVGDLLPLDIFIGDAHELRAFELRFAFDPEVLRMAGHDLVGRDFEQFLITTAPRGSVFPTLFEMEKPGRYFLAAAEFRGTPDSGSGVLARLTMEVLAPGRTPVTIVTDPSFLSPRLTDADNLKGEDLFQGPVSGGEVAVGEPCSPSSSTPDPSPESGSTPTSEGESGSSPSQPGDVAVLDAPPALVSLSDAPLRASSGEGTEEEASDASAPSGTEGTDEAADPVSGTGDSDETADPVSGTEEADETADRPSEDGDPDQGISTLSEDDSSSGIPWLWSTILALAVFGLVGGSALIALNLRSRA